MPRLHGFSACRRLQQGLTQAVIEFDLDGTVLRANDNFLRTMGYRAEQVIGHRAAKAVGLADQAGTVILQIRDGASEAVQAVSMFANERAAL